MLKLYLIHQTDNWIGLNSKGHPEYYSWSDGWPYNYANWNDTQPPVNSSSEVCVRLNTDTGKWITDDCAQEFKFACKHHNGEWGPGSEF